MCGPHECTLGGILFDYQNLISALIVTGGGTLLVRWMAERKDTRERAKRAGAVGLAAMGGLTAIIQLRSAVSRLRRAVSPIDETAFAAALAQLAQLADLILSEIKAAQAKLETVAVDGETIYAERFRRGAAAVQELSVQIQDAKPNEDTLDLIDYRARNIFAALRGELIFNW